MLTSEALAHYKTRKALAAAAKVNLRAVYQWDEDGDALVPPLSAAILAKASRGKLKFDPERYLKAGWNQRKRPS